MKVYKVIFSKTHFKGIVEEIVVYNVVDVKIMRQYDPNCDVQYDVIWCTVMKDARGLTRDFKLCFKSDYTVIKEESRYDYYIIPYQVLYREVDKA